MKIQIVNDEDGSFDLSVTQLGRGHWVVFQQLDNGWVLQGYCSEDVLYILLTGWQSGDFYVTIVHCRVDCASAVARGLYKPDDLEAGLNTLIGRLVHE